ncbi:MAG: septum formation initiator family protein [Acidobacteria bacterium]|nr:septum formation initiator family protein [Acidobacteriota bacterium]
MTARTVSRGRGWTSRQARYAILAAAVLGLAIEFFGDRGLVQVIEARRELASLERDVARLRDQNRALQRDVQRLTDDPSAIEELARRDLGLIRPGEVVFILRDRPAR